MSFWFTLSLTGGSPEATSGDALEAGGSPDTLEAGGSPDTLAAGGSPEAASRDALEASGTLDSTGGTPEAGGCRPAGGGRFDSRGEDRGGDDGGGALGAGGKLDAGGYHHAGGGRFDEHGDNQRITMDPWICYFCRCEPAPYSWQHWIKTWLPGQEEDSDGVYRGKDGEFYLLRCHDCLVFRKRIVPVLNMLENIRGDLLNLKHKLDECDHRRVAPRIQQPPSPHTPPHPPPEQLLPGSATPDGGLRAPWRRGR